MKDCLSRHFSFDNSLGSIDWLPYVYTVCAGVWARCFQTTNGNVGRRNFQSHGALPKLGPQIWSLQRLPQRARCCYWGAKVGRNFGAQKRVCESDIVFTRHCKILQEQRMRSCKMLRVCFEHLNAMLLQGPRSEKPLLLEFEAPLSVPPCTH